MISALLFQYHNCNAQQVFCSGPQKAAAAEKHGGYGGGIWGLTVISY